MNRVVEEWISKAEADFATAEREFEVVEGVNYDAVCFHAQQVIEKLMKGLLIAQGVTPPKVHDLAHLSRLLAPVFPDWNWPLQELHFLSRAAVEFRYPGERADREDPKTGAAPPGDRVTEAFGTRILVYL
jgi:HEPN domain-containing protein